MRALQCVREGEIERESECVSRCGVHASMFASSSSLLLSSLELSGTKVYEPQIRARLGATAHVYKALVLELALLYHDMDLTSREYSPTYTPHPTTYTLHPRPNTLHPTLDTRHPAPYPAPCRVALGNHPVSHPSLLFSLLLYYQ